MKAYLDNSATTKCSERAIHQMLRLMTEDYGNPSAMHLMGAKAEESIKTAADKIAKTLKVKEKEIFFTSGGTEANNLAIIGSALANKRAGSHLITSAIEHASVWQPFQHLEEMGFRVTYLPVDEFGILRLDHLEEALDDETIFVSLMQVNNEIGAVEPIGEASAIIRAKAKKALIHMDAIQSYGKMAIYPKKLGVDMLSVSGHKFHGPKGIGFLYVQEKTKIKPILYGGGQQRGMRSGTENVPAIAGLGEAAADAYGNLKENACHMRMLREYFVREAAKLDGVFINGPNQENCAPHIVSVSTEGVRSEVLLHALEEKGIYVSAGSACSSHKPAASKTLKAIGLRKELLDCTVRFSFCPMTTKEELDYALENLAKILPFQRKFTRK